MGNKKVLILTYPRQASHFFIQCLTECTGFVYRENYFESHAELSKYWGGNTFKPPDEDALLNALDAAFVKDDVGLMMDRSSSLKMPILAKAMRMVILYRERRYTFPTSRPQAMLVLFDKFMRADFSRSDDVLIEYLQKIRLFMIHLPVLYEQDQCIAMHIITTFIKLYYARKLSVPVIRYEQLMTLDDFELARYLGKSLSCIPNLDLYALAERIISRRDPDALMERSKYDERVQRSLINYITNEMDAELGEILKQG